MMVMNEMNEKVRSVSRKLRVVEQILVVHCSYGA